MEPKKIPPARCSLCGSERVTAESYKSGERKGARTDCSDCGKSCWSVSGRTEARAGARRFKKRPGPLPGMDQQGGTDFRRRVRGGRA